MRVKVAMDLVVYLNGEFLSSERAKISLWDHGFLYGDGVFETIRIYNNKPFRFEDHIERLFNSAKVLEISIPLAPLAFLKAIEILLRRNGISDATARIAISRGEGEIGLDMECGETTVVIMTNPFIPAPKKYYDEGIDVVFLQQRKMPNDVIDQRIKSFNYLPNIMAKRWAKRQGAHDGLFLNMEGYVCEATTSNVFFVINGELITPHTHSGIMEGITRKVVIELANKLKINFNDRFVTKEEALSTQECFLTNTNIELLPVKSIDKIKIGTGKPGIITKTLHSRYKELVK